jgi:long-subunit fatty acid transport protein
MLLLAIVCLAAASNCFAITDEAIFRSFEFSFVNPGARSGAMGGAFIALADDATAAEANPAGLTILTKPEVSFEYRHTETNNNELNKLQVIAPPGTGLALAVETTNEIEEQDQPSWVSVVFPAGDWVFGFSRQEFVKQDAIVNEDVLTNFGSGLAFISTDGSNEQDIVNWNFSAAVKFSEGFSLGATVRYSQLDWLASTVNTFDLRLPNQDPFVLVGSETSIDDSDSAVGFNVGGLWKSQHASFGLVYKYNPTFEVTEHEEGLLVPPGRPTEFTNVLNVPDTLGGGIAIKPNDTITVSADVTYIKFSDLEDDFSVAHSVFTLPYDEGEITYKVDNGFDFRVGSEFIVFLGTVPVALRAGYYRKASNSVVTDFIGDRFPGDQIVLPLVFAERDDTNHFTFGSGFVFGQNFQLDWAMDTSNLDDTFVLSSVVRF